MQKSLIGLVVATLFLTSAPGAVALGLGGIEVTSALGQTLRAEVGLLSVNKLEKASLVARLASPDAYKDAGLAYPYGNKFTFKIESRDDGEPYIRIATEQPINDPFVSLLLELSSTSGKLVREYTFLLDPPNYTVNEPAPVVVQTVAPVVRFTSSPEPEWSQPVQEAPNRQITRPVTKPPVPGAASSVAVQAVSGKITVKRGDTLSSVATANQPDGVSLERMLVALYRANADQFDGGNMNRIRAGKQLQLPGQDDLMQVSQADAEREIRAQASDWNNYRQKLASAASSGSEQPAAQQVASGKIASSVEDKAAVVKQSAKEVLKLSKGAAAGDQVAGASAAASTAAMAEDKKNAAQEELIAKNKAMQEGQSRAALLEKNLQNMEQLLKLKTEAAALAQQTQSAEPTPAATPTPAKKETVKPAVQPKPVVVEQEEGMFGSPLFLAGGAALLLGLGGLGLMLSRRRRAAAAEAESASPATFGSTTGSVPVPAEAERFAETVVRDEPVEVAATQQSDDVDPIAEADLFMNFGRDAQAEDILTQALQSQPQNHQIHLKLLDIYAKRNDTQSFAGIARQLKDSGDDTAWQQALTMGRKLEASNPLYGGTGTLEDADSATMQTTALDAPLDLSADKVTEEKEAAALDFDLDAPSALLSSETVVLTADDMEVAQDSGVMDFDVTATNPSMFAVEPEQQSDELPDLNELIFDVTSAPGVAAQPGSAATVDEPVAGEDAGMEFSVDSSVGGESETSVPQAAGFDLSGINLNLEQEQPSPDAPDKLTPEEEAARREEVDTKLDLAKAYQHMGDIAGVREILEEVLLEGDAEQQEKAQAMLSQLG
ncbi:MAG: FimV/HubP family polar landmark protein [Pseudomonadota bacterium]